MLQILVLSTLAQEISTSLQKKKKKGREHFAFYYDCIVWPLHWVVKYNAWEKTLLAGKKLEDTPYYTVAIYVLFIYSAKACLREKTPPRLGHLAPASEVTGSRTYLTILELADRPGHALFKIVRYVLLRPLRPELDGQDVEASSREDTFLSFR
jgi:hypothetical protein